MILLTLGAGALARLMRDDPSGPDTEWLLHGPADSAATEDLDETPDAWPLAAE